MNSGNIVGQTLDEKYRIERELGKGGMGAVYLATHIGTERPVAIKVIVPQFMQKAEFVERFKREARAAGRLRHPNVVDVTDFGFAETLSGRVAYLVMEYLDGCTLGEILEEEKNLPVAWSLDILEQVCSAVQEAHNQGIIHRDLKPDNIWLEPDGRGGYTVKVLDFGIAKLEENHTEENVPQIEAKMSAMPTNAVNFGDTVSEKFSGSTRADGKNQTAIYESGTAILPAVEGGTLIQPVADLSEKGTAILHSAENNFESGTAILPENKTNILKREDNTKIISQADDTNESSDKSLSELTRVGAVLGTPLYMSPEQCKGEKLDARSDIYSLAVIAYQMISGKTPFTGDYRAVMEAHKFQPPPVLEAKKVPSRLKRVLLSGLAKNPAERPPTAEAFAGVLRSYSEGVWTLMGKAMVIYSENFLKFTALALIIYLPMFVLLVLATTLKLLEETGVAPNISPLTGLTAFLHSLSGFFCGAVLTGIVTWLVAQKMAVPMRPLKLRPAFAAVKKRLKTLFGTVVFSSIASVIGLGCFLIPGILMWICWALVTPVVMMEDLKGKKAFARSYQLVRRKFLTTTGVILLSVVSIISVTIFSGLLSKGILGDMLKTPIVTKTENSSSTDNDEESYNVNIGPNGNMEIKPKFKKDETEEQRRERHIKGIIRESAFAMVQLPLSILAGVFFAIVLALLYIKTRLAGGESISDLLEQFEETDQPRTNWQRRIRERLEQSGRITSKT